MARFSARLCTLGRRGLAALAVGAALSGCGQDPSHIYSQAFGFQCADMNTRTGRALCLKSDQPGAAQVSRYCYKTLADANCFDRPDPDSKNQALGSAGY